MQNILITGAGKIGALIAGLLASSGDYRVYLADLHFNGSDITRLRQQLPQLQTIEIDVKNQDAMAKIIALHDIKGVVSCLPFYCNVAVATLAKKFNLHYFDLTEDVQVTTAVQQLAQDAQTAFVPQCGLAPGFINIGAHTLMQHFDSLDTASLRVGALPQYANNALQYALTWSIDGLINEYGNECQAIEQGQPVTVPALENLEHLLIDGVCYEAFNTSGGLGTLAKTYAGKVRNLNYKTIRYPGHCEKIRFLMNDLKLNQERETLKRILENSLPRTYQDVIVIYIAVAGMQGGQFIEETYVKKIYPQEIAGLQWSGIQVTTGAAACAVIDLVHHSKQYRGFISQEQFTLPEILDNRFGKYFK